MATIVRLAVLILALGLLSPATSPAQQWSPAEQEVRRQLEECWASWMDGVKSGSPERWFAECSVPQQTYWPAGDGAPLTRDFSRRNWDLAIAMDRGWVDIRPVLLTVMDDVAVLHFYGYWKVPGEQGETITVAGGEPLRSRQRRTSRRRRPPGEVDLHLMPFRPPRRCTPAWGGARASSVARIT